MSERLTVKYDDGSYGIFRCDNRVEDKLGKIEDIEEELGIDLVTLFKAMRDGAYVNYMNGGVDFTNNVEYQFGDIFIYFYFDNPVKYEHLVLELTDYGFTWALTKEELE